MRTCESGTLLARRLPTMGAGRKIKVGNNHSEEVNHVLMTASVLGKERSAEMEDGGAVGDRPRR